VVLRIEGKKKDLSKTCKYCIDDKGWKGIGYTKERTYKKEKKGKAKAKKAKAEEENSESDEEEVTEHMVRVGKVGIKRKGWFQLDPLRDIQEVNIPVEAHGSE